MPYTLSIDDNQVLRYVLSGRLLSAPTYTFSKVRLLQKVTFLYSDFHFLYSDLLCKCARTLTCQNFFLNCCSSTRQCSSLAPRSHARRAKRTHRDWGEYNTIRNSEENTRLSLQRHIFSKEVSVVVFYSKCTRVLTLENLCLA